MPVLTATQRFWSKVDKSGDCWLWTASSSRGGYGAFRIGGAMVAAHRFSWEQFNGPIPDGKIIDHRCCNPLCVNPFHLRAVTVKQNAENRAGAQRNSSTGVRGVRIKNGRWCGEVQDGEARHHVGYFDSIEEAAEAVRLKRIELFTHNDRDRA